MSAAEQCVTQEREQANPSRVGPREAAHLANATRAAGITRASARAVLELLLRHTRGSDLIPRSTRWIAREIGASYPTAVRAIDDLVAASVVIVITAGTGRKRTEYLVDVARVLTLVGPLETRPEPVAETGEDTPSARSEGPQFDTPAISNRYPRGISLIPPSARARPSSPLLLVNPLPPQPSPPPKAQDSPAASRGDPLRWQSQPEAKCVHGRTRAQGGCRLCHTTRRDDAQAAKREQAEADVQRNRLRLAESRAAESRTQALSVAPPPGWRHR